MTTHRILVDRRNLFSWLSRGLITPPSLTLKYREDEMGRTPDHLSVLPNSPVASAPRMRNPVVVEVLLDSAEQEFLARGALSAARLTRVVVKDAQDLEELSARIYDGFDPSALNLVVDPELFEEQAAGGGDAAPVEAVTYDSEVLRLREAVAGGLAMVGHGRLTTATLSAPGDPLDALVSATVTVGLVSEATDRDLLRTALRAVVDETAESALVATELVSSLGAYVANDSAEERYLKRISQLLRGESELDLRPGGLMAGKALALFLLRPEPAAVQSWVTADLDVEPEVLMLAKLMSGISVRFAGLSVDHRGDAARLLDWVASGLTPNDFTSMLPKSPAADLPADAITTSSEQAVDPLDALESLRAQLAADDHASAVILARAAGWEDCLRMIVLAACADTRVQGKRVRVEFPGNAAVEWRVEVDTLLERAGDLEESRVVELLNAGAEEPRRRSAPRRRATPKTD